MTTKDIHLDRLIQSVLDLTIDDESKVTAYRTRVAVSFKYHGDR